MTSLSSCAVDEGLSLWVPLNNETFQNALGIFENTEKTCGWEKRTPLWDQFYVTPQRLSRNHCASPVHTVKNQKRFTRKYIHMDTHVFACTHSHTSSRAYRTGWSHEYIVAFSSRQRCRKRLLRECRKLQ